MRKLGWLGALLVTASCGFPRPADVGSDDDAGVANCQLTAIEPALANTGDTIAIEGTFVDAVTVNFPGDVSVAATVIGQHRAMVSVPVTTTAGDLTITACGTRVGPLSFRRTPFPMGLGRFEANLEQTDGAHQNTRLVAARDSHTANLVGRFLYIIGGVGSNGSLDSVELAMIHADGSLGPFATSGDARLSNPRQAHTSAVLGTYLYIIGGFGNGSLNSVERATITPDGKLGPFGIAPDSTLVTPRQGHANAVVGNYLYVLGGFGSSSLNSIERATINADGSIGMFSAVSGVVLSTARYGHTVSISGEFLYVVGGTGSNGPLDSIERARINPDGSLGPFSVMSDAPLTTARSGHTASMFGDYLYVLGGADGHGPLNSIERALVNADGSLGAFATASDVALTTARRGHASAVVGNYLYILGGAGSTSVDSVERTTINAGGSLEPLVALPGSTLVAPRYSALGSIIGNYLYIIGGRSQDLKGSIERATVNIDGSLGPFATVPGVTLATPRTEATTAIIGNYLYILGGSDANTADLNEVERATINPDASLGTFATVSDVTLLTARSHHTAVVVGPYLYVLGGLSGLSALNTIERATISADGSLSSFAVLSDVALTSKRFSPKSVVVGNYLYILGGFEIGLALTSAERALINSDGTLGKFVTIDDLTVTPTSDGQTTEMVGNSFYIIGGENHSAFDDKVQRSTINADGSLGPFATIPNLALVPARDSQMMSMVGNYLYVLGGLTSSGQLINIERAQLQ